MVIATSIVYLPGEKNLLDDVTSRQWDITDDAFLDHFNLHFRQRQSWLLCTATPSTRQRIINIL